jgi:hypothetical protein
MKNINNQERQLEKTNILSCYEYLTTPKWSEFFHYTKDREALIELFESFINDGYKVISQPHKNYNNVFSAKLMNKDGKILTLISKK